MPYKNDGVFQGVFYMNENGWVNLEDHLGTDITVVNSARVSFGRRIDMIRE